jgi:hypothetical protein
VVSPDDVAALLHKYRTLQQLGDSRAARMAVGATSFPPEERPARREAMQKLAARFPGVLRELDLYDAAAVSGRIMQLEAGVVLPWMVAVHRFHAVLEMLLRQRRGRAPECPPELAQRAARPPEGKLSRLAQQVVASEMRTTVEQVVQWLA